MTEQQERKNRYIGIIAATGIHVALLAAMFLLVAWRLPNPPFPEIGTSLNIGLYDEGSGDVQPEIPSPDPTKDTNIEEPQQQQAEELKPEEPEQEETGDIVSKDEESPVVVKEEQKKEIKPEPVKENVIKKEKPPVAEPSEEEREEVKKTDAKTTAGGKSTGSQGDDINKKGDKGKPEGTLDPNGQYTGKQGGGGGGDGLALSMSGWAWADKPVIPDLLDNADGRIVFEIECDEDGEIVGITTIERGLSPRSEQMLKEEIRKNSLIRLSSGQVPERSKGRVVFVLKTK